MSQVRVAKGIPNQPLLKQTRFSNSLAKQKNTKKYLRPKKKNTKIQLNISKMSHHEHDVAKPYQSHVHAPMTPEAPVCFATRGTMAILDSGASKTVAGSNQLPSLIRSFDRCETSSGEAHAVLPLGLVIKEPFKVRKP